MVARRVRTATLVCLMALAGAEQAHAFCRTTTCDRRTEACVTDENGCNLTGLKIKWLSECITFSVQRDGSPLRGITAARAQETIQRAFDTWSGATCSDGGNPSITIAADELTDDLELHFQEEPGNTSVWLFRDDGWPYANSSHTLALSTLTLDLDHGRILDVDVELNSADYDMTTTDDVVGVDFESIVTHEAGHFLGLDHSPEAEATMFEHYAEGSMLRDLAADDVLGICTVYPPNSPSRICEPDAYRAARIHFERRQKDDGCSVAVATAPGRPGAAGAWTLVAAMCAVLARRRTSRTGTIR